MSLPLHQFVAGAFAVLAIAACSSTPREAPVARIAPVGYQSATAPLAGAWMISDGRTRQCSVVLSEDPIPGTGALSGAIPSGACGLDFDDIRGWYASGTGLVLTNSRGEVLAVLLPEGGGYAGTFTRGYFKDSRVTLVRTL